MMVLPTGAESDADSVSIAETEIMDSPGSPYPEARDDGRVSVQCEEDLFLRNGNASASARRRRSIPPPILPNRDWSPVGPPYDDMVPLVSTSAGSPIPVVEDIFAMVAADSASAMDVVPAVAPDSSDSDTVRAGRAVYLSQLSQDSYYDPWEQSWEAAPARAESPLPQDMGPESRSAEFVKPSPIGLWGCRQCGSMGIRSNRTRCAMCGGYFRHQRFCSSNFQYSCRCSRTRYYARPSATTAASTSGTRAPASDISSIHVSTPSIQDPMRAALLQAAPFS